MPYAVEELGNVDGNTTAFNISCQYHVTVGMSSRRVTSKPGLVGLMRGAAGNRKRGELLYTFHCLQPLVEFFASR